MLKLILYIAVILQISAQINLSSCTSHTSSSCNEALNSYGPSKCKIDADCNGNRVCTEKSFCSDLGWSLRNRMVQQSSFNESSNTNWSENESEGDQEHGSDLEDEGLDGVEITGIVVGSVVGVVVLGVIVWRVLRRQREFTRIKKASGTEIPNTTEEDHGVKKEYGLPKNSDSPDYKSKTPGLQNVSPDNEIELKGGSNHTHENGEDGESTTLQDLDENNMVETFGKRK